MKGALGKRVCAKWTESFWVRVTMDDVTNSAVFLSRSLATMTACLMSLLACFLHAALLFTTCHILTCYGFSLFNSELNSDLLLSCSVFPSFLLTLQMETLDKLVYFFVFIHSPEQNNVCSRHSHSVLHILYYSGFQHL